MQIICWQIVAMTVINAIIEQAKKQEVEAVIPPKKNRKIQRPYDKELYKLSILLKCFPSSQKVAWY